MAADAPHASSAPGGSECRSEAARRSVCSASASRRCSGRLRSSALEPYSSSRSSMISDAQPERSFSPRSRPRRCSWSRARQKRPTMSAAAPPPARAPVRSRDGSVDEKCRSSASIHGSSPRAQPPMRSLVAPARASENQRPISGWRASAAPAANRRPFTNSAIASSRRATGARSTGSPWPGRTGTPASVSRFTRYGSSSSSGTATTTSSAANRPSSDAIQRTTSSA